MKAIRIHAHGGVDQLRYQDAPDPKITSPRDVIVELKAAALNHIDIWVRMGSTGMQIPLPHILGADGAGVVVDTGPESPIAAGAKVCLYSFTGCGACEFCRSDRDFMCIRVNALGERLDGTYAAYVKVAVQNCFPIPTHMNFIQAAAFPLVFVTAWRMLVANAQLQPGERVLIVGIGGGVAGASLQIAKRMGAQVFVTSGSDEKLARAVGLGADHIINHGRESIAKAVDRLSGGDGVDVVVDSVGGSVWRESLASLAPTGRLVTCGATAGGEPQDDLRTIIARQLRIYGSTLGSREDFRQMLSFVELAQIEPIIDSCFPLADARGAQERLEQGRQFGKIVLQMPD